MFERTTLKKAWGALYVGSAAMDENEITEGHKHSRGTPNGVLTYQRTLDVYIASVCG